jgi:hypothetical protein
MLGRHYRFYPTAWWLDRDRPSVITRAQLASTGLAGMRGSRVVGITTVLEMGSAPLETGAPDKCGLRDANLAMSGATLHVRVTPETAGDFTKTLRSMGPGDTVLALLAPDPLAGGRFAWVPGAKSPQVITGPGFTGRVTGSFLAIGIAARATTATLAEDGAILFLTPAERDAIVTAIDAGRDHRRPAAGDSVAWAIELVRPKHSGPGALAEVQLLTDLDQIGQRISTPDLAAFLEAVEREVVGAVRAAKPAAAKARVHVTLRAKGRTIRVEPVPADGGAWVEDLRRRIERLPPVVVTGEVALVATFTLGGAAGSPGSP